MGTGAIATQTLALNSTSVMIATSKQEKYLKEYVPLGVTEAATLSANEMTLKIKGLLPKNKR